MIDSRCAGTLLYAYPNQPALRKIAREVGAALKLRTSNLQPPVVIVPIDDWNRVAERAVRFGLILSDDITAVHVSTENAETEELQRTLGRESGKTGQSCESLPVPRLEIISSPYRRIHQPILDFVNKAKKEKPDRLIAVIIPQLVEPHWY